MRFHWEMRNDSSGAIFRTPGRIPAGLAGIRPGTMPAAAYPTGRHNGGTGGCVAGKHGNSFGGVLT